MLPISGSAGGGGPSAASSTNESGWNVSFGSGGVNAGSAGDLAQYLPYAVLIVGAIIAIRYLKNAK